MEIKELVDDILKDVEGINKNFDWMTNRAETMQNLVIEMVKIQQIQDRASSSYFVACRDWTIRAMDALGVKK